MRFQGISLLLAIVACAGCAAPQPAYKTFTTPVIHPVGHPGAAPSSATQPASAPAKAFARDLRPVCGITLGLSVTHQDFDGDRSRDGLAVKLIPLGPDGRSVQRTGWARFVLHERRFDSLQIRGDPLVEWRIGPRELAKHWEPGLFGGFGLRLAWAREAPRARYALLEATFEDDSGALFTFTEPTVTIR